VGRKQAERWRRERERRNASEASDKRRALQEKKNSPQLLKVLVRAHLKATMEFRSRETGQSEAHTFCAAGEREIGFFAMISILRV
jgi:hypothetical protein